MGASSPMCDLLVVRCSNIFCALPIHGERVAAIPSLRVFALCPRRSIFLAGGSEQPHPPTRPTRVHGSARSIFRDHPPHSRPKLNCALQATLAMQCDGAVAGPHALPGLPSPRPTWELRLWSSRSTRPSFTEAYLGASTQAVRMPAVVRMPACHSRRFKGERPIGAATGEQSQPLRPCAKPPTHTISATNDNKAIISKAKRYEPLFTQSPTPKHATRVWHGCRVSLGISPAPCASRE